MSGYGQDMLTIIERDYLEIAGDFLIRFNAGSDARTANAAGVLRSAQPVRSAQATESRIWP